LARKPQDNATGNKAWNEFNRWCRSRGLSALPAHPWTVAAYLRWSEPRKELDEIVFSLKAIARRHLLIGSKPPDVHPMVTKTMRMVEIAFENRHARSNLFSADDFIEFEKEDPDTKRQKEVSVEPGKKSRKIMRSAPKLVRRKII